MDADPTAPAPNDIDQTGRVLVQLHGLSPEQRDLVSSLIEFGFSGDVAFLELIMALGSLSAEGAELVQKTLEAMNGAHAKPGAPVKAGKPAGGKFPEIGDCTICRRKGVPVKTTKYTDKNGTKQEGQSCKECAAEAFHKHAANQRKPDVAPPAAVVATAPQTPLGPCKNKKCPRVIAGEPHEGTRTETFTAKGQRVSYVTCDPPPKSRGAPGTSNQ